MSISSLSQEWISVFFLSLLFQNLVVEERSDIREATLAAWKESLHIVCSSAERAETTVPQPTLLSWYQILMTPLGVAIDTSSFYHVSLSDGGGERHNVDKHMLAQDLSLVSADVVMQTRLAGARALASLIAAWPIPVCSFPSYLDKDLHAI
jgi:TATA-binding protein-associated factor